jgi:hypothetical protein
MSNRRASRGGALIEKFKIKIGDAEPMSKMTMSYTLSRRCAAHLSRHAFSENLLATISKSTLPAMFLT